MKTCNLVEMLQFSLDDDHMKKIIASVGEEGAFSFHEEADAMREALSFCADEMLDHIAGLTPDDPNFVKRLSALGEINRLQEYIAFVNNSICWWDRELRNSNGRQG
ncbi:hypothetical protein [Klebsiella michiganensis]|uniref:hypothetical protein n=1 Tax=Klebsiella michiganensis TaxID=1134687 RepID=UPI000AB4CC17|nr:hypothetical protein [Klebsiella oxytoca]HED2741971.1 hypothetical protein [Klebsiella michiganensis]HBN5444464.1 hypothetical protein [Klebsiella oxytoca]HED2791665.1 hypothetical protein [Klebsiella michiganensis]HED2798833.1 hypothetical protein [Klebsiella michiganensis]